MADFRAFTIAASVTAIVLGAGLGAALGAISGPQPPLITTQQGPASTALDPEVAFSAFSADGDGRANAMLTASNGVRALQAGSRVSFLVFGETEGLLLVRAGPVR